MKKLIDVSSYNGVVKLGEGKGMRMSGSYLKDYFRKDLKIDNGFNRNYQACNENELAWGVYNSSYATTATKAKSDMKLVCDIS